MIVLIIKNPLVLNFFNISKIFEIQVKDRDEKAKKNIENNRQVSIISILTQ